jgi:hypothetical protein
LVCILWRTRGYLRIGLGMMRRKGAEGVESL